MFFFRQIKNKGKGTYVAAVNYANVDSLLCVFICQCYLLIHIIIYLKICTLHVPSVYQEGSIYLLKVRIFMNAALWLTTQKSVKEILGIFMVW